MASGQVFRDYFNLGFSPTQLEEVPLALGGNGRERATKILWEVAAWLLVALGIFLRKALTLPGLGWDVSRFSLPAFLASCAISLAVFPPFMRWVNRRRSKPSFVHVATPFAFGFFLDLTAVAVSQIVPRLVP